MSGPDSTGLFMLTSVKNFEILIPQINRVKPRVYLTFKEELFRILFAQPNSNFSELHLLEIVNRPRKLIKNAKGSK